MKFDRAPHPKLTSTGSLVRLGSMCLLLAGCERVEYYYPDAAFVMDAAVVDAGSPDPPPIRFAFRSSPANVTIGEGQRRTFGIALTRAPHDRVDVSVTERSQRASIVPPSVSIEPSAFADFQTIEIIAGSDDDANDELLRISIAGNDVVPEELVVAVLDDEVQLIRVEPAAIAVTEGETATIAVSLAAQPASEAIVRLTSLDRSRVEVSPARLTFGLDDWSAPRSVLVRAELDPDASADRVFVGLNLGEIETIVPVQIADSSVLRLSAAPDPLSLSEGRAAVVALSLSAEPSDDLRVELRSTHADLVVTPEFRTFTRENWRTPANVRVSATDDEDVWDEHELLIVSCFAFPTVAIPVDIRDDDRQRVVVTQAPASIVEGQSTTFALHLAQDPGQPAVVSVALGDRLAWASRQRLVFGPSDFARDQEITIRAAEDVDTVDQATELVFSADRADDVTLPLQVLDDDSPDLVASPASLVLAEGGSDSISVSLAFAPAATTTVSLRASDSGRLSFAPLTLSFSAGDFWVRQTVSVVAASDVDLVDDVLTLTLSTADASPLTIPVHVIDADVQSIEVPFSAVLLAESASVSLPIHLGRQPQRPVRIVAISNLPDLVRVSPPYLGFDPSDFDQPKVFVLTALADSDAVDTQALVTLSDGHTTAEIAVTALEGP
ncbi:MAG: hypothetical protein HYV07_17565 [Deltaproteobacteria bacterium]|nr:hypothetical protein [Deltaproteobacteria bacterium]